MEDYIKAHKYSALNKEQLKNDAVCGCFCCLRIFPPKEIKRWADRGETTICPYCCVDSVIGESSGYPITKEFLKKMNEYWF